MSAIGWELGICNWELGLSRSLFLNRELAIASCQAPRPNSQFPITNSLIPKTQFQIPLALPKLS